MRAGARRCCRRTDRSHRPNPRCAAASTPGTRPRSDWSRARGTGGAKNGRTVGSRGSTSPKSLKRVATVSNAVTRWRSRSRHSRAASARSSDGPSAGAQDNRANAVPSHLLYGAYSRSIRNASRIRSRTEPGRDHCGPELVADLPGSSDERLFLGEPVPLAREDVPPDVVGIPRQLVAHARQVARAVFEHFARRERAQQLRRRAQPITRTDTFTRIESQHRVRELADGAQPHLVARVHSVTRREARRISAVRIRQRGIDDLHQLAHCLSYTASCCFLGRRHPQKY